MTYFLCVPVQMQSLHVQARIGSSSDIQIGLERYGENALNAKAPSIEVKQAVSLSLYQALGHQARLFKKCHY